MLTEKIILTLSTEPGIKDLANDAANRNGLKGVAEYIRLALVFLVEHDRPPEELRGQRSILKIGRPTRQEAAARIEAAKEFAAMRAKEAQ